MNSRPIRLRLARRAVPSDSEKIEDVRTGVNAVWIEIVGYDTNGKPTTIRTDSFTKVKLNDVEYANAGKAVVHFVAPVELVYVNKDGDEVRAAQSENSWEDAFSSFTEKVDQMVGTVEGLFKLFPKR